MKKALSLLICLLSFMVVFTACSGGGSKTNTTNNSGTGGGNTQINDTQQGAQTSITTRNIADDVIGSFGLTNLVGSSNMKDSSETVNNLIRFAQKIKPLVQKARLLKASEQDCDDGIPDNGDDGSLIFDDLGDQNPDTGKITYNQCRDSENTVTDGVLKVTCSDENCDIMTVTFGEGTRTYLETTHTDSSYTNKLSEFKAICVLSESITDDDISYNETITGDGYINNRLWDDTSSTEERIEMSNFIHTYTETYGEDIALETYKITNSSLAENNYDNTDLVSSKEISFKNFHLLNRLDDSKGCNYVTIDGIYTVELTPQDSACFVGTFSIDTIEELTDDLLLEQIIDGKLKINENTTVIYDLDINDNLTMSVTVNGQTEIFNETDIAILEAFLEDSCPQLISISAK